MAPPPHPLNYAPIDPEARKLRLIGATVALAGSLAAIPAGLIIAYSNINPGARSLPIIQIGIFSYETVVGLYAFLLLGLAEIPLYGLFVAWGILKGRLRSVLLLLGAVHLLASLACIFQVTFGS